MTRLNLAAQGALVGLALLGSACQGELKLLNGVSNADLSTPPDMTAPPEDVVSFRLVSEDMDQSTLGCTSKLSACHGGTMPTGILKLGNTWKTDPMVFQANYDETVKRIDKNNVKASTMLTKPLKTAVSVPHMGGKSIFLDESDPIYIRWLNWARCGAQKDDVKVSTCPPIMNNSGADGGT